MSDAPLLYDSAEHEPLTDERWNEHRARAFVSEIVRGTDEAFDPVRNWPLHPEDRYGEEPGGYRGVYCGAAGVMWALRRLAIDNGLTLQNDYAAAIASCEDEYRANPWETGGLVPSYFLGTTGILTARFAITGDPSVSERLEGEIWKNVSNPTREAFWGASGSALGALLIRERNGERRFDAVLRAVQDELWRSWAPSDAPGALLWEQDMYGQRRRYVGIGHGAIGNLAPFIRAADVLPAGRQAEVRERVVGLLQRYALSSAGAVNWISIAEPPQGNRMQWCHGAPGVVNGLAFYTATDARVEHLLRNAGEAIWRAGPLEKGPSFCHGTAGNGYAFLRLWQRTGEAQWLQRAQHFAMHAIRQAEEWRARFAMRAYSLWTGELGVALFVSGVLRKDPNVLGLDVL